jgi:MFS family permease
VSPSPEEPGSTEARGASQRSRIMYRWDRLRGLGVGLAETTWQVFALLVAIRVFSADDSLKQFIPAGAGIGLLLTPVTLALASRTQWTLARLISVLWVGVALAIAGMVVAPGVGVFIACILIMQVLASQTMPFLTSLYSRNYRVHERGSKLSTTFVLGSSLSIGFGFLGGKLLDWRVEFYPVIFLLGLAGALIAAFACSRMPSTKANELQTRDILHSLSIAWKDKLFAIILSAWMLMGLGNLMLIPLRVEYLANPAYGVNATNAQISILLVSIVLTFRVLSTKIWGWFFDRINVMTLRVVLNMVFMISIACFFFTRNFILMSIGCALLGVAFGGGGIMWTLYVTKIAPPDRVVHYMSVHGFLTGLRMTAAPFIGYTVIQLSHPATAAWIAMLLISVSTLIFLPLRPLIETRKT